MNSKTLIEIDFSTLINGGNVYSISSEGPNPSISGLCVPVPSVFN